MGMGTTETALANATVLVVVVVVVVGSFSSLLSSLLFMVVVDTVHEGVLVASCCTGLLPSSLRGTWNGTTLRFDTKVSRCPLLGCCCCC